MKYRLDVNKKFYVKLINLTLAGLFFLSGCSIPFSGKEFIGFDCKIFSPVCGEDGITYYNQCQAEESGVEIVYDGACNGTSVETVPYEKVED
jgi:hypothetical protein